MTTLQEQYKTKILPELKSELKAENDLAVPRITKIVVNAGIGKLLQAQPKNLERFQDTVSKITGQKPLITRAAKAISGFKVREGQIVGLVVTLRGKRMYDFLDKLVNITLPRIRDFRGISRKGFDGRGNYSLGIREHIVFPEMAEDTTEGTMGVEIVVVTTARTNERGYRLLKKFGFPFQD